MASSLPLPIPPRTPTPPSDDGAHHAHQTNEGVSIDRDALSPLRESFSRSISLDPENHDLLSPAKPSLNFSPGSADTATSMKNGSADATMAGPFNFNTTVMAKSPVIKSV